MRIGRRPIFFLVLAVICSVMIPFTPAEYRWLNVAMALLAVFWSVLLAIEDISNARRGERGSSG